jgi:hypothetical protein
MATMLCAANLQSARLEPNVPSRSVDDDNEMTAEETSPMRRLVSHPPLSGKNEAAGLFLTRLRHTSPPYWREEFVSKFATSEVSSARPELVEPLFLGC